MGVVQLVLRKLKLRAEGGKEEEEIESCQQKGRAAKIAQLLNISNTSKLGLSWGVPSLKKREWKNKTNQLLRAS